MTTEVLQVHPDRDQAARRKRFLKRIRKLFNRIPSGWGRRESVMEDAVLLWAVRAWEAGYLKLRISRMSGVAWPSHMARGLRAGRRTESPEHIAKRRAAQEWLKAQGFKDALCEVSWLGYRADVLSAAHGVIVEVGHTPIEKMHDAVREGVRFLLVPFRDDFYEAAERTVIIEFVASKEAIVLMDELEEEAYQRRLERAKRMERMLGGDYSMFPERAR